VESGAWLERWKEGRWAGGAGAQTAACVAKKEGTKKEVKEKEVRKKCGIRKGYCSLRRFSSKNYWNYLPLSYTGKLYRLSINYTHIIISCHMSITFLRVIQFNIQFYTKCM